MTMEEDLNLKKMKDIEKIILFEANARVHNSTKLQYPPLFVRSVTLPIGLKLTIFCYKWS